MGGLRSGLIRLAHANKNLRPHLVPLLKNAARENKVITVTCAGDMGDRLEELLKAIKWVTDIGSSRNLKFPMDGDYLDEYLVKEMEEKGFETTFGFDGDGADHITKIEIKEIGK